MEQVLLVAHPISSLAATWYTSTSLDFEFTQVLSTAISLPITGCIALEMLLNALSLSFIFCKMDILLLLLITALRHSFEN